MMRRRQRRPRAARAPAAPLELRRRRPEQIPTGADVFPWKVGELIEGVRKPKRGSSVLDRCRALYSRSAPDGDA
jgi:hypothetical protein